MTPAFERLIAALRVLPGVGPKTAQRMALHLLQRDREGGARLVEALQAALQTIGHCQQCRNLSEDAVCALCSDPRRDASRLCVVESPADVLAIEQTARFTGRYFVLGGHLSPIDGVGPEALGLDALVARVAEDGIAEVILATNATVEGEATAHYVAELLRSAGVALTRIAHGVPLGGELEFVDGNTLAQAFAARTAL